MSKGKPLYSMRKEYAKNSLVEHDMLTHPVDQFCLWLNQACQEDKIDEAYAMTLSTVDEYHRPLSRIVLLRAVSKEAGFVFFTNYLSKKGKHIALNAHVSLLFHWPVLERQVKIRGEATKLDESQSDDYFARRPFESQIAAVASEQSSVIESRPKLEELYQTLYDQYKKVGSVKRPEHWGGFQVTPSCIEFWQGRPNRLHDRLLYEKQKKGGWSMCRLCP